MNRLKVLFGTLIILIVLSGCSKETAKIDVKSPLPDNEKAVEVIIPEQPKIDYNSIKANESGKIMVLMYHGIGNLEEEWVRTADNFKKDLKALYDKGYRTLSLHDYINNNINTPSGFTPVVITFDDSIQNQFNFIEKDGEFEIDSTSAVGIMDSFSKEYKGFGNAATFYVYFPIPFRQKDRIKDKFEYLIKNGYDIGNHSYTHEMLGKMDAAGIQKQLALNVSMTGNYIPGYTVDTLALPYGSRPKDEALRKYLISGEYDGTKYTNNAVLLVGSNPAPAPNSIDYNPSAIPRIRASDMKTGGTGIYDWLKYFDLHPENRYISDGDPETVVVPKSHESGINKTSILSKEFITY